MTPTTEQLKDLLAKVTPDWWVSHVYDENEWYGSAVYMDDKEKVWLENDYNSDLSDATLIALAPTLAAEVVRLREALEQIALQDQFHCRRNGEIVPEWGLCGQIARQALDATSEK